MSKPFISVVVPTMRMGGFDILVESLKNQTFKDFELVVADGVQDRRPTALTGADLPFPVTHVQPFGNRFPVASFCRYANTAIAHARGEVLLFIVDYTWLPPEALEVHAAFHRQAAPHQALMAPSDYFPTPDLHPDFPSYDDEATDDYAADVAAGKLDDFAWSVFAEPLSADPRGEDVEESTWGGADPKLRWDPGPIPGNYFHAKNASVRRQRMLDINGWNEDLDGTHAFQDTDLADRLVLAGVRWTLTHACPAMILNPRHVFPFAKRLRDWKSNEALWRSVRTTGYAAPINPQWSLAAVSDALVAGEATPSIPA